MMMVVPVLLVAVTAPLVVAVMIPQRWLAHFLSVALIAALTGFYCLRMADANAHNAEERMAVGLSWLLIYAPMVMGAVIPAAVRLAMARYRRP